MQARWPVREARVELGGQLTWRCRSENDWRSPVFPQQGNGDQTLEPNTAHQTAGGEHRRLKTFR